MVARGRRALALALVAPALVVPALAVPASVGAALAGPSGAESVRPAKNRPLTLAPAVPLVGERAVLSGRVPGPPERQVRLQVRRPDGTWRGVQRGTTRKDRTFAFRLAAAATVARTVRVLAPATDGAAKVRSRAVRYVGRSRAVRLVVPTEARAGEQVVMTAISSPPRPGQPVNLELGDQTVDVAAQDAQGRAVLSIDAPPVGLHELRAGSPGADGAAGATSATEVLRTTAVVTGIPRVDIVTDDGEPITSKETYKRATFTIDPRDSGVASYADSVRLRVRGNFTAGAPDKLPYKLKLDDGEPLAAMPKSKDWVLLANYYDTSLLRTTIGMEAGRRLGLPWSPRFVDVEVWLNGTFKGLYQLGESIEVDEDRVDIDLAPETADPVNGGFLVEADSYLDSNPGFTTERGLQVYVKEPEDAEPPFVAGLAGQFEALEDALYSADPGDPVTGYPSLLDVDSFVDWYLVMELMKTVDAGMLNSVHLQRDVGGRIAMGPVWDFDISAGKRKAWDTTSPQGWFLRRNWYGGIDAVPSQLDGPQGHWFVRLFQDPAFERAVRTRWSEVRASVLALPAFLDVRRAAIAGAAERNFAPVDEDGAGLPVKAPNPDLDAYFAYQDSWTATVDDLDSWLTARIAWMDSQLS